MVEFGYLVEAILKNCGFGILVRYPPKDAEGYRFLNSGLFIGYAADLYRLATHAAYPADGNDQVYYAQIYVDERLRRELDMKLDHRAELFQNLFMAQADIELRFSGRQTYAFNKVHGTRPLVLHANGPAKLMVHALANYIPQVWNVVDGCTTCLSDIRDLAGTQVTIGVECEETTVKEGNYFIVDQFVMPSIIVTSSFTFAIEHGVLYSTT